MAKYRLKKTYDGYCIERKVFFFWMVSLMDYDGNPRYGSYDEMKKKLDSLVDYDEYKKERREDRKREEKLRKKFPTSYVYPPLPDEEPK